MLKMMKDLLLTYKSGGIAAADALYLPPCNRNDLVVAERPYICLMSCSPYIATTDIVILWKNTRMPRFAEIEASVCFSTESHYR